MGTRSGAHRPDVKGSASAPEVRRTAPRDPLALSFVHGSLFFRLMNRWGPGWAARAPIRSLVAALALLAWLPLLLLSALQGEALGSSVAVPFLLDVEAHIRFLVVLPLLMLAAVDADRRLNPLLQQFTDRCLVPEASMGRFDAAVASAIRLRNSALAEVLLIAIVYGVGVMVVWRHYLALDVATWYAAPAAQGSTLTMAGVWYGYVSLPIVQFLLLRWYLRLILWARLLWQVSRIELNLVPTHPDRAGGLGFLANSGYAFTLIAAAHGALVAGQIASRIFFAGARLPQFADQIGVAVVFVLCLVFAPLLFFSSQLAESKRSGLRQYGALAGRYVREFDAKWLRGGAPPDEALVGSADIQSLADLGNSYEVVRTMRFAPISKQALLALVVATLIPIAPLLLTMIPIEELLLKLFSVVF